ncbi:SGNH/GDSL hydrolase family protein [Streptomyces apocyni]|uniref:SGNH/GDSL hydrolase family protein n=1 Tax=Streptomyces apocyni TaxID=2654677 RepID=UPI001E5FE5A5|nr:SGNH/GDSL hydrolase family protein [Streptomyces apocyni]
MGKNGRSRTGAAVTAMALALLTGTLAGCDPTGGAASAPVNDSTTGTPSAEPTPRWNPKPASLAAVGDSITRAFNTCKVLSDCPEESWATGTDDGVNSLAIRLLGEDAADNSWNYARSGARVSALTEQMKQAAEKSPELVTVLIGANDACRGDVTAMTPVSTFRADFEDGMRALRREEPKAQVFVASVPDLKRLWSEGRSSALGKQMWKLGICPAMLADADAMDKASVTRRDTVRKRVMEYNEVLRDVCAEDPLCRYDDGAVFDYRFGTKELSRWDWFHPSKAGQSLLAEVAYREVTGQKPPA